MINVGFYFLEQWGIALHRCQKAIEFYVSQHPEKYKITKNWKEADLIISQVIGPGEIAALNGNYHKSVFLQHCHKTASPDTIDYPSVWQQVKLVASFNDLASNTDKAFNFLHMPLGADPAVFDLFNHKGKRENLVFATGHIAETELLHLLYEAVQKNQKIMQHTGENFKWDAKHYKFNSYMSDSELVKFLNNTQFVFCMRDIEGFEMLGIEGLFCGAVPIVPNIKSYDWYREWAYTVDVNTTPEAIVKQISDILSGEVAVPKFDIGEIKNRFSWNTILSTFFSRIEETL